MDEDIDKLEVVSVKEIERDLRLRGYEDSELTQALETPVLIIPGPITPEESNSPIQRLTPHIAFISKELSLNHVTNRVILQKGLDKHYVEERHAHVDLGALVIYLHQLGGLAKLTQVLDLLLKLIQLRFTMRRTQELTPNVKFDLHIRDGKKVVKWRVEGPADALVKMTTPQRLSAIVMALKDDATDDE